MTCSCGVRGWLEAQIWQRSFAHFYLYTLWIVPLIVLSTWSTKTSSGWPLNLKDVSFKLKNVFIKGILKFAFCLLSLKEMASCFPVFFCAMTETLLFPQMNLEVLMQTYDFQKWDFRQMSYINKVLGRNWESWQHRQHSVESLRHLL